MFLYNLYKLLFFTIFLYCWLNL